MTYLVSFFCVAATSAITLIALVAIGKTNGVENLLIVALAAFSCSFAVSARVTRRRSALITSAVSTLIVVGGGFGLLYALFSWGCAAHPSSC
jgi:hypothetical protein